MAGLKGLAAKLFSRESIAKEFDPETEEPIDDGESQNGGHGSGSEESSEDDTKDTEHYVQVGKSKLRQKQPLALGPEYRGVRVSRAQIEQESEDDEEEEDDDDDDDDDEEEEEFDDPDDVDPEADDVVDSEDEIDSDDAFGSDDEALKRKFTFRGSSKPRVGKKHVDGEDEEDDEAEEDDEDDEAEEDDEDDEGDSEDGSEDGSEEDEEDDDDDSDDADESEEDDEEDEATAKALEEARKILAQDQQRVVSSLSQSAKADADKGFAVRQQRRAFDALLNVRIRMQKALVSANSLDAASAEDESATVDDSVANDAEAKAIKLLNTISSIRQSFYGNGGEDGGSATKRKRGEDDEDDSVDTSVTCEALFDRMVQAEEAAVAKRRKVLDRWSQRVQRPGASGAVSRRSGSSTGLQSLVDLLESQLATPDRLIRRTQTPRSCAPVQVAKRVPEDPEIYDDADFYQLLLKELVDQRAADATAPGGSGAPTVRWATTAVKEAKTRKLVDRRASKGRKMRFNVHEKLQNFMAPEDRRTWEPEAIDRLFSTLFGQRIELREDDDANNDDDQDEGGALLEEESLRLFRN